MSTKHGGHGGQGAVPGSVIIGPVTPGDGTAATPAYATTGDTNLGWYRSGTQWYFTDGGTPGIGLNALVPFISMGSAGYYAFTDAAGDGTRDLFLRRGAANILSISNSTSGQTIRLYNTTDSDTTPVNFERLSAGSGQFGVNRFGIAVQQGGTGSARPLDFGTVGSASVNIYTNNTARWGWDTSGHYVAQTHNTYDIGAAGATSPRTIYVGTAVAIGTNPASSGAVRIPNAGTLSARNAANSGDVTLAQLTSSDVLEYGNAAAVYRFANNASANISFFAATPVAQRLGGVTITNNIAVGGTTNQLDNWTDLTTYATDAAAIRNACYQLGRKQKLIVDALRTIGLLQNADA